MSSQNPSTHNLVEDNTQSVGSLYENCISKSLLQVNERVRAKVDLQKQSSKVMFTQV